MKHRTILWLILVGSLLLRVGYWSEIRGEFLSRMERWPDTDMSFFQEWAQTIGAGDLLTDRVLHPFHSWHGLIGSREEWEGWYGGKAFHQAPLYPYFLALVETGLGLGREGVTWIQMILGLFTVAGVYGIGRRCGGPGVGLLAAAFQGLCATPIFHETLLLRATLLTFLHVLIVIVGGRLLASDREATARRAVGFGVLCGLLILTRPNGALLLLFVLVFLVVRWRRRLAFAASRAGLCLAGVVLALLPLVVRNTIVGVSPLSLSSVGGVTFTMGSARDVSGVRLEISRDTRRILEETDNRVLGSFLATLATHGGDWTGYLAQLGRKTWAFFHGFEAPDNGNPWLARRLSLALRMALPFGWLAPFGLVGLGVLLFSRRRGRGAGDEPEASAAGDLDPALRYGTLVVCVLTLLTLWITALLFYPSARFRQPVLPVLAVLAAVSVFAVLRGVGRESPWRWGGLLAVAALLFFGLNLMPPPAAGGPVRRDDLLALWQFYSAEDRDDDGIEILESLTGNEASRDAAREVLLEVRASRGEWAAAASLAREVLKRDPDHPLAHLVLSRAHQLRGDRSEALRVAMDGIARRPDSAPLHRQLAELFHLEGRENLARAHRARAEQLEARSPTR